MKKATRAVYIPKHNPELDKYVGVDLFPEKTARAREFLRKNPIPDHLLKRSSK